MEVEALYPNKMRINAIPATVSRTAKAYGHVQVARLLLAADANKDAMDKDRVVY